MHALCVLCVLLCPACALLFSGCGDDGTDSYAPTPAFMRVQPVTALAPLRTALTSPGYFCALTYSKPYYHAKGTDGTSAQLNGTALEGYGAPVYICGIIVGTPSLPNTAGSFYTIAYDQACPNCYEELINKALTFPEQTKAHCERCKRSYDLNTSGIVIEGGAGKPLLRYGVQYDATNDVVVVR